MARPPEDLRLLCVLAHPDDESLGTGGTLAQYAKEGVSTYVVTATRGERGRFGDAAESPGLETVGQVREGELRAAAHELGVKDIHLLGYVDGDLDKANPAEAVARIVSHLRRIRPHVVITFDPFGAYGHPDHIAISQLTTAAVSVSADPEFLCDDDSASPHAVSKLYYMAWSQLKWEAYQAALKTLKSRVDDVDRHAQPWPEWALTTEIDTRESWELAWRAVSCHQTQMSVFRKLETLSPEHHQALWGSQHFYRVFSLVNGGRARETDLFEGLR